MKRATVAAVSVLLTACATAPERIAPVALDYRPFLDHDCALLTDWADKTEARLKLYTLSQNHGRTVDAITWPVSTTRMFGKNRRNVEAIARLTGERDALRQAQAIKCAESPLSPTANGQ